MNTMHNSNIGSKSLIKLIALDVDGTLVNDHHQIMPLTKQMVQAAAAAGLMVVLCTGRGPLNTLPILQELKIDGYMLTHNGAVVCRSNPFAVIRQATFAAEQIAPIIRYCRAEGVHFDLCTATDLYCESLGDYEKMMYEHFLIRPIMVKDVLDSQSVTDPIVKLTLFGNEHDIDQVEKDCRRWENGLNMIRSDARFIDFMVPGVTKGASLSALCQQYSVLADEVIAIGNYYNDLEMIQFAGVGIAMGNAPEDLKQQADEVTADNNQEGVYYALKKYL